MKPFKCVVENENVVAFLEYLHSTNKLTQVIPSLEVPAELVEDFVAYVERTAKERKRAKCEHKQSNWTEQEINKLDALIDLNTPIPTIVETLNRSPSAVRGKAARSLGLTYKDGKWTALTEKQPF